MLCRWETSGLSQIEFCRQNDLNRHRFNYLKVRIKNVHENFSGMCSVRFQENSWSLANNFSISLHIQIIPPLPLQLGCKSAKRIFTIPVLIGIRFPEIMSKSSILSLCFHNVLSKISCPQKIGDKNEITNLIGNSSACLKVYVS